MVRADLLDCVDKFMQLNCGKRMPFGGKQTIFFGDLYQLPPVIPSQEKIMFKEKYKTGYFFSSEVMKELPFKIVELDKIFRQKERSFIEILNAIRNNTVTEEMLNKLNNRFMPDFEPEADSFYIFLTTRNDKVFKINQERLKQLSGEEYTFNAQVRGKFDKATYPTDEVLHIKEEAQVMLLNNDSKKRWVNGSIGKVIMVIPANDTIMVQLTSGDVVEVAPYEWDIFKYFYNSDTDTIETEQVGYFKQFPLRLSWAITIHKAQGKTFDNVIFDIGSGAFTPGQVYVGLSRCATLDGLVLKKKIRKQDIFIDRDIVRFMTEK